MQDDVIRASEVQQYMSIVDPRTEQVVDVLAVRTHDDGALSFETLQSDSGVLVVDAAAYVRLPCTLVATRPYLGMLGMLLVYVAAAMVVLVALISSS